MPFAWLRRRPAPPIDEQLQEGCAQLPKALAWSDQLLRQQRFVVLDLETSGLNMQRDQLLSIGAVVIEDGAIDLAQQFECTLQRSTEKLSASVLIHGIAPSVSAAGVAPGEALLAFMQFVGDSPLLAFHAPFDQHMLSKALKTDLGYSLEHRFLDVADLAPMLCPEVTLRQAGLDDWTAQFGLQVQQRHHASADALVTAELALILFSRARKQQLDSPAALADALGRWQRRQQRPSL
ncbi:DNA polymerase-3 subunit epsilon [Pseudomonas sp. GV071]|nr:DNA polymerase-3 subunit epsilon [Pseudomonas sp. GV071]